MRYKRHNELFGIKMYILQCDWLYFSTMINIRNTKMAAMQLNIYYVLNHVNTLPVHHNEAIAMNMYNSILLCKLAYCNKNHYKLNFHDGGQYGSQQWRHAESEDVLSNFNKQVRVIFFHKINIVWDKYIYCYQYVHTAAEFQDDGQYGCRLIYHVF